MDQISEAGTADLLPIRGYALSYPCISVADKRGEGGRLSSADLSLQGGPTEVRITLESTPEYQHPMARVDEEVVDWEPQQEQHQPLKDGGTTQKKFSK